MPNPVGIVPSAPINKDRRAGGDRRATTRFATIILENGERIPCVIRDLSATGAKLGVARRFQLPERFLLQVKGREPAFPVQRAWQRGDHAGVQVAVGP